MDPYLILKIGNQEYQTSIKYKGGKDVEFNERYYFVINSFYKHFGRQLEVEVWDQDKVGKSYVGFGIVDVSKVIDDGKSG